MVRKPKLARGIEGNDVWPDVLEMNQRCEVFKKGKNSQQLVIFWVGIPRRDGYSIGQMMGKRLDGIVDDDGG